MSKPLAITARQVTALCKGAAKAGYIPEIVMGDIVIRLVPEKAAFQTASANNPETFNTLDQYLAWRDGVRKTEEEEFEIRF